MNIELNEITVRDLVDGYADNGEKGVVGYGGNLDIRPAYQREFIYGEKQREKVVDSVMRGFPLNVMYWAKREDGSFEVLDGQQRTMSLCEFSADGFPFDMRFFSNFKDAERDRFFDYRLMVYVCEGNDLEKLDWFRTINIAGERLTEQELRNAVYAGSWTGDAKRYFSRKGCPAQKLGGDYVSGAFDRQEVLETAIRWLCAGEPEGYMAMHQHDASAAPLWLHFQNVISWVRTVFPRYRAKMKGLDWGRLFREYGPGTGHDAYDPTALEARVAALWKDDEVQKQAGISSSCFRAKRRTNANSSTCGRSRKRRRKPPTQSRAGTARFAASISNSLKCRATTSCRGARAARRFRTTSRCSARSATKKRAARCSDGSGSSPAAGCGRSS